MDAQLKKIALFLIITGIVAVGRVSAQAVLKVGGNPAAISTGTALEVESTTKGFLLPRMTKAQRDAIVAPPAGLQLWCTDCNTLTTPASGEYSINYGSGWVPFSLVTTPKVSTGKKSDPNAPVRVSTTSATINGVLISNPGTAPTEVGMVWKEIIGTDFGTLPSLDANGVAQVPVYKTVGTLVTTVGAPISITIPSLTSTTSNTRPYYFRTYAKNSSGVGYGNTIIFNCAPPVISAPVVTGGNTGFPTFAGTLSLNAGTPQGTITEYGYYTSTTNPPNTAGTKVVLSTPASLATLNATLNSETFTADPTVDLTVNNYAAVTSGTRYFNYYVITNGVATYSSVATFSPIVGDPITGGSAVATITSIDPISVAPKIGVASSSTITVRFNVTQAGTYASFVPAAATGATTGLSMPTIAPGNFALGAQSLTFSVNGTPATSLVGNSFAVSRIGTLSTGTIQAADLTSGNAICDGTSPTIVVPVSSTTGRVWMDRNLGASRAGIASNDYQAYGCLYQWGRGNDGHSSMNWTYYTYGVPVNGTTTILSTTDTPGNGLFITGDSSLTFYDWRSPQNNMLWQGVSGTNNPCPAGFRIPSQVEFANEITVNSITTVATAYSSIFKFTLPSARYGYDGRLDNQTGQGAYYWTSTTSGNYVSVINMITYSIYTTNNNSRNNGFSVRCIQN